MCVKIKKEENAFVFGDKDDYGIRIEHKDGKILVSGWAESANVGIGVWETLPNPPVQKWLLPVHVKFKPWEVELGDFLQTLGIGNDQRGAL